MLNSNVIASPGGQHVPASESWVQTTAAPESSFSPFLRGTWFKTGVSLLCELSLVQGWKSWASHSPLPQSESPHSQQSQQQEKPLLSLPRKVKEGYCCRESCRQISQATKAFQHQVHRLSRSEHFKSPDQINAFFFSSSFSCITQKSLSLLSELFRLQGKRDCQKALETASAPRATLPRTLQFLLLRARAAGLCWGCQQTVVFLTLGSPFISGETGEKTLLKLGLSGPA